MVRRHARTASGWHVHLRHRIQIQQLGQLNRVDPVVLPLGLVNQRQGPRMRHLILLVSFENCSCRWPYPHEASKQTANSPGIFFSSSTTNGQRPLTSARLKSFPLQSKISIDEDCVDAHVQSDVDT